MALGNFGRVIGAFLLYTAATIILVKYLDEAYKFINSAWVIPIAIASILIAYFLMKQSPLNSIKR